MGIGCADEVLQQLYQTWRIAESKAHQIFEEVNDNENDPYYIEVEKESHTALHAFLRHPTTCPHCIRLKLAVACQFEDFVSEALDPDNRLVAGRAIVAVMYDLENLTN
ncbi:MAG: hypothetical protein KGJ21_07810 [Pseudomonadota bacterium]|nr:hypothetical protein [Pseudomonadota bacterium]